MPASVIVAKFGNIFQFCLTENYLLFRTQCNVLYIPSLPVFPCLFHYYYYLFLLFIKENTAYNSHWIATFYFYFGTYIRFVYWLKICLSIFFSNEYKRGHARTSLAGLNPGLKSVCDVTQEILIDRLWWSCCNSLVAWIEIFSLKIWLAILYIGKNK